MELLAARRVVAGPEDLLPRFRGSSAAARTASRALRLLARTGARLLAAERLVDRAATGVRAREALRLVQGADLACGEAVLVSAARWAPGVAAREAELKALGAESPGRAARGRAST